MELDLHFCSHTLAEALCKYIKEQIDNNPTIVFHIIFGKSNHDLENAWIMQSIVQTQIIDSFETFSDIQAGNVTILSRSSSLYNNSSYPVSYLSGTFPSYFNNQPNPYSFGPPAVYSGSYPAPYSTGAFPVYSSNQPGAYPIGPPLSVYSHSQFGAYIPDFQGSAYDKSYLDENYTGDYNENYSGNQENTTTLSSTPAVTDIERKSPTHGTGQVSATSSGKPDSQSIKKT